MRIACPSCGHRSPGDAAHCAACGSALLVLAPIARGPSRGAIGPTIRLAASAVAAPASRSCRRARALPIAALLFTVVFSIGLASYLAAGWTRSLGPWPLAVLVGGALLAQQSWLHGQLWRGLCGMALWGGMIWLLVAHREVPWGGALLLAWLVLRPIGRLRRTLNAERRTLNAER